MFKHKQSRLLALILTVFFVSSAHAGFKELNNLKAPFTLPPLPYAANSLEPVIDAETMKTHHDFHHKGYVDKLNEAARKEKGTLLELMKNASERSAAVRNNSGGHWNHSFFWSVLTPDPSKQRISKKMESEIIKAFGSMDKFKQAFEKEGIEQFGSGWAWLIRTPGGELEITATANQDNPLMDVAAKKGTPILGIDVWEHAYYLKYKNQRAEYLKNFWKIVNWRQVEDYDNESRVTKIWTARR